MKKLFLVVFLCTAFLFMGSTVMAYPILQLDIAGGTYVGDTTYGGPTGELYAFLNPDSGQYGSQANKVDINDTYYISLAVVPSGGDPGINPTSFSGASYVAEGSGAPNGLPPHYPFQTYYWEYEFQFSAGNTSDQFDAQTDPFPAIPDSGGDIFYYAKFDYDVSNLLSIPGIDEIHFDLYSKTDGEVTKFAPFSHDASAVPEPATLLLLGGGLLGLAGFGRKRFKK